MAAFQRWASEQRVSEAASGRARQRWLSDQAAATATWAGMLVDLAEGAAAVTVAVSGAGTGAGLKITGNLVGIGPDFCVVDQANRRPVLIALASIVAVWPPPDWQSAASGDRNSPLDLTLADAIAALAEDRMPVLIRAGDHSFEGDLWALGDDVVTLRSGSSVRRLVYLALSSISVCEIR